MEAKVEVRVQPKPNPDYKQEKAVSPGRLVWNRLSKNKLAISGMFILLVIAIVSVAGPWCSPYTMESMDFSSRLMGPSGAHLLGTDHLGRDVFTRLMYAGRISLTIGIVAVLIEVVIGGGLGAVAGFYGGKIDGIIMRGVDIFLCLPFLPLLIVLGAILSDFKVSPQYRIYMVMLILGLVAWPVICRVVRGQILSLREQEFMQATEAVGLKDRRKIFNHLLPNTFPAIIVAATLGIGSAILTESALSFLGLGVMPPTASWGNMIQVVNDLYSIQHYSWLWVPPGVCILLTVMAINLFGDGLRDALDPKLKK
ncbi:Dipeptide transport system permease protein DppC [Sporomusa rhizae]|uniref:oligopeptide ABC transporter permease n=1 Tax=Sporomusa rhizae TaxID=357999 RepID=UPI00352BC3A1